MSRDSQFSEMEEQFFSDGDALADAKPETAEDFSDLDPESGDDTESWVKRALAALSLVRAS